MPIKKYMNILLRHAFTGKALSSDAEAVAIWLARPQNSTLGKFDIATNAELDKDSQQRLRKELLKAVPHLTRSARQLWRERCQKASVINCTGTGSPSPMTVSAYSPDMYVSTKKRVGREEGFTFYPGHSIVFGGKNSRTSLLLLTV
jgi:hypothetical protein